MISEPEKLFNPYEDSYFEHALLTENTLKQAPSKGKVYGLDWVERIESGGEGVIYVIRSNQSSTEPSLYVLKRLKFREDFGKIDREAIFNECLRMLQLSMECILELTGVEHEFEGADGMYLKMPYCQGLTFRDRLNNGKVKPAEIAYHQLCVAIGLDYLHEVNVVHRDIKPSNVFFIKKGEDSDSNWRTVIGDFGITVETNATIKGIFRGSSLYASPEQLEGAPSSPCMDIWAWGVMCLEALLGQHPYEALLNRLEQRDPKSIAKYIREWAFTFESNSFDDYAFSWLAALATRCINIDPSERPNSNEIIETYGKYVRIGDSVYGTGSPLSSAVVIYPFKALPLPMNKYGWLEENLTNIPINFGLAWDISQAGKLFRVRSASSFRQAINHCQSALGLLSDENSVISQLRRGDEKIQKHTNQSKLPEQSLSVDFDNYSLPAICALEGIDIQCASLIHLVDAYALPKDLVELRHLIDVWEEIGRFPNIESLARLAQALIYIGEPYRAIEYINRGLQEVPDDENTLLTARLLHCALGNYVGAAQLAIRVSKKQPTGLSFVEKIIMAIVDFLEINDIETVKSMLEIVESINIKTDITSIIGLIAQYRLDQSIDSEKWSHLRHDIMTTDSSKYFKLRYALECAWYYGDKNIAQRRANILRSQPQLRLFVNQRHLSIYELMSTGRSPLCRDGKALLEAKAELWDKDGRPQQDLLSGLYLVAAYCWTTSIGGKNTTYNPLISDLIKTSFDNSSFSYEKELRRRCYCISCWETYRLENLGICVYCRGLYCYRCRGKHGIAKNGNKVCQCGGEVVG